MDKLRQYQDKLKSWLASLDDKQQKLQEHMLLIDQRYPSWKEKYDLDQHDITRHDARREYFRYLAVILQNVRLSFIFMRDQLCTVTWWEHFEERFQGQQAAETLLGYQTMARQYSYAQMASITEHSLAAIACSGHDCFALPVSNDLNNASEYVLARISRGDTYRELFDILRLVRNSIHSNGIFSDRNGKCLENI